MKHLGQKILKIMNDVKFIQKSGFNEEQNYSFVKESDIAAQIREALIKHGVCFLTSVKNSTITPARGGYLAKVDIEVTLLDTDSGETFVAGYSGTGLDFGDKAVYMATTGAEKYALLKIFLLETGDDPENAKGKKGEAKAVAPSAPAPAAQVEEQKVEEKPEQVEVPAPVEVKDGGEIISVLQGMGFTQVDNDKELKGTTYMLQGGEIVCRAFRRAMLEGMGFSWVPEAKAFKRAV